MSGCEASEVQPPTSDDGTAAVRVAPPKAGHLVGFFESDEARLDSVVRFLAAALEAGDAGVLVATPAVREEALRRLHGRGLDPVAFARRDQLIAVDAAELLATFLDVAGPDRRRFREAVEPILDRAASTGRRVHVYGEMVALLWDRGDVAGTMALEDLWNELHDDRAFVLLCGYPTFSAEENAAEFEAVCRQHAEVITPVGQPVPGGASLEVRLREPELQLQSRETALGMVAHELRSAASLVAGALALLREFGDDLEPGAEELLDTAAAGIGRIERLSNDLGALAGVSRVGFRVNAQRIELSGLIERTVRVTGRATGRQLRFVDPGPVHVLADPGRQGQVLDNLLANAVAYSPDESTIQVHLDVAGKRAVVTVADSGSGIDPADHERVFEPFVRLGSTQSHGMGLGLHLVRQLVEGQGGRIWVESAEGSGTAFRYDIPLAP